jgi:transposase-like protein
MAEQTMESGLARLRGRRPWTEDEARRVIEAWKTSGLTVSVFARRAGLAVDRVYRWRARLGAVHAEAGALGVRRRSPPVSALVPVVVRTTPPAPPLEASAKVTVCTREGLRVEVTALEAASAAWVATLVRSLGMPEEVSS